ncbi:DUF2975 domain-containing protein [Microbacterium sp. G2-8]|uniref:DUF2975 domain-containing protein n=1 Tax=Microbacterium sp. G2-8 TaxID=2842454 RepID=UPI001C8A4F2B|nr:DUF2975 domain-containing protein [Microbacterium sp. G2-8]
MSRWITRGAQAIVALAFAGALFLQTVLLLEIGDELSGARERGVIGCAVAFLACAQVVLVCVWRLLALARQGLVFRARAFRWVDAIIGACGVAGIVVFAAAVLVAPLPDDGGPAPGVVLLVCVFAAMCWGVALVVTVMRGLLAQAIASRAELDEVI